MTTALTETDLAARWSMSPKTLQRWRSQQIGPAYLKFGKQVRYPVAAVEDYENLIRTNVAFKGADEILLYLAQTGHATVDQIRAACLGGKKSHHRSEPTCIAWRRPLPQRSKPLWFVLTLSLRS